MDFFRSAISKERIFLNSPLLAKVLPHTKQKRHGIADKIEPKCLLSTMENNFVRVDLWP